MSYVRLALTADQAVTFNLFRRRSSPDLFCAVAQAHAVPAFIDGEDWSFAGVVRRDSDAPRGFKPADARLGAHLNGFYLFFAFETAKSTAGSAAAARWAA